MPLYPFEMRADGTGDLAELRFDEFLGDFEPFRRNFKIAYRRANLGVIAGNADGEIRLPIFELEMSGSVECRGSRKIGFFGDGVFRKIRGDAASENVVEIVYAKRTEVAGPVPREIPAHSDEMELGSESKRLGDFAHCEIEEFADAPRAVHEVENGFDPSFEFERRAERFDFGFELDAVQKLFAGMRFRPGIGRNVARSGIRGVHALYVIGFLMDNRIPKPRKTLWSM